jgi:beta-barrel assembly-enhancing protease
MKSTFTKVAVLIIGVLLTGCANMPDLKGLPTDKLGLPGLGSSSSSSSSTADSLLSAGKSFADSVKDIPEDEEVALGEQVMSTVLGAVPIYNDERVQRYVNRVGRWVASNSERPNLPWRFVVVDTPLVNAGAAPGGQVFISTGLLGRMTTEAELAGALAHEIAHVVQKHQLSAYRNKLRIGGLATLGSAVVDSKVKSGSLVKEGLKLGIGELRTMAVLALDRGEEEQADRMGMALAARAGYDPYGLPSVLNIIDSMSASQSDSLLYATHPSAADRLASLNAALGRSMEMYGNQPKLADRFSLNVFGAAMQSSVTTSAEKATNKLPAKPVKK